MKITKNNVIELAIIIVLVIAMVLFFSLPTTPKTSANDPEVVYEKR